MLVRFWHPTGKTKIEFIVYTVRGANPPRPVCEVNMHCSAPIGSNSFPATDLSLRDCAETRACIESGPEAESVTLPKPRIAVLIPCLNEEGTVAQVVRDFRAALPDATVFVYDNASSDATAGVAALAGAKVRYCEARGKGNVVRHMFSEVDADVYVLVDGDATYEAEAARRLVALILDGGVDMCVARREPFEPGAYRAGHMFGNALLSGAVAWLYGPGAGDMLSGYRALSRKFVRSFEVRSAGFEIEAELTIHALRFGVAIQEITTRYRARPPRSASKLRTIRDGLRILWFILRLYSAEIAMPRLSVVPVRPSNGFGLNDVASRING